MKMIFYFNRNARSILLSFTFITIFACCSVTTQQKPQYDKPLQSKDALQHVIPRGFEKTHYYKIVNSFAEKNNLPNLREVILPADDIEIRIFLAFDLYGADKIVLKRTAGKWSAMYFADMICHLENKGKINFLTPRVSWEEVWRKLVDADIFKLSGLNYSKINDGKTYIIEINSSYKYQVYVFENPEFQNGQEFKQILEISKIIADNFDLVTFKSDFSCN